MAEQQKAFDREAWLNEFRAFQKEEIAKKPGIAVSQEHAAEAYKKALAYMQEKGYGVTPEPVIPVTEKSRERDRGGYEW